MSVASRKTKKKENATTIALIDQGKVLYGDLRKQGILIESHTFNSPIDVDWGSVFPPGHVVICINVKGQGQVKIGGEKLMIPRQTITGLIVGGTVRAFRNLGEDHEFIIYRLALKFLKKQVTGEEHHLHSLLRSFLKGEEIGKTVLLKQQQDTSITQWASQLVSPPVTQSAHGLWYQGKLLELISELFFEQEQEQLFCHRQKMISHQRVQQVQEILLTNLSEAPSLKEISQQVGCSASYLSRIFSREMGMTISQFLQNARIAKAAELLRSGKYNVTEAAYEVGYSSLSHFSKVFYEVTGCCPGLYPNQALFSKEVKMG